MRTISMPSAGSRKRMTQHWIGKRRGPSAMSGRAGPRRGLSASIAPRRSRRASGQRLRSCPGRCESRARPSPPWRGESGESGPSATELLSGGNTGAGLALDAFHIERLEGTAVEPLLPEASQLLHRLLIYGPLQLPGTQRVPNHFAGRRIVAALDCLAHDRGQVGGEGDTIFSTFAILLSSRIMVATIRTTA